MTATFVLGVSMSSHDRSAALMRDGVVVAAVAEERLDRRKKSHGFYAGGASFVLPPMAAVTSVLRDAGVGLDDLALVVCGRSVTSCRQDLLRYLPIAEDKVVEPPPPGHHLAHAYSAYVTSPFRDMDVLVIDEQGHHLPGGAFERATGYSAGPGGLRLEQRYLGGPGDLSLGMYFDVFAALTGLAEAGLPAAGKLMALAGSGRARPDWPPVVEHDPGGHVRISLSRLEAMLRGTGLAVDPRYDGVSPRSLDDLAKIFAPVHWGTALAADLARFAQHELEEAVLHTASCLRRRTGGRRVAYAGGVALNCTANARLGEAGYDDVFVHPAATDDGAAVGLAGYGWIEVLGNPRPPAATFSARLGPRYDDDQRRAALEAFGLAEHAHRADPRDVARRLVDGELLCWFSGRSEWGPRALGGRSILADPTSPGVVHRLNSRIKFREPFRPFGISVTSDAAADLLQLDGLPPALGPFMLCVAAVRDSRLRQVTHADGTVRYQTVTEDDGSYYLLLRELGRLTGLPAVLNTSFNTHGEPLVESPRDAVRQFLLCEADGLYLDGLLVLRSSLPASLVTQARASAVRAGGGDPLRLALQQEAAGHPQAAARTLDAVDDDPWADPERRRSRAALAMRLALHEGDVPGAVRLADEMLRWSGLPRAAVEAATTIARNGPSPALPSTDAADLLRAVGGQGAAAATLRSVFADLPST